jgi:hypothetical protein
MPDRPRREPPHAVGRALPTLACLATASGTLAIGALTIGLASPHSLTAQTPSWVLELEAGPAWQSYNDAEVPNDGTATRFSLQELTGSGPWPAGRLYLTWNRNERHGLRLLVAPLSLTESGTPSDPIEFAGESYQEGEITEATYTFNSYRLSYRYRFHEGDRTTAWVGFTGKVRDAEIELAQGTTSSRKTDVGFVPLLHLSGEWRATPQWSLEADLDALAGGPGRAADLSLTLGYDLSESIRVRGGYRTVEGGADVTDVYAFAWLHYATFSVVWSR